MASYLRCYFFFKHNLSNRWKIVVCSIEALITTNMSSLLATPESQMDLTSTPRLCGSGSRLLVDKVQFASPVEKFSVLTQFFLNADGKKFFILFYFIFTSKSQITTYFLKKKKIDKF